MSDLALFVPRAVAAQTARPLLPLSVRGLTLRLGGQAVLDGLDLALAPGGCTVLMGPNGAGKSLLLKVLHGLVAPGSGEVSWNGTGPARPRRGRPWCSRRRCSCAARSRPTWISC